MIIKILIIIMINIIKVMILIYKMMIIIEIHLKINLKIQKSNIFIIKNIIIK